MKRFNFYLTVVFEFVAMRKQNEILMLHPVTFAEHWVGDDSDDADDADAILIVGWL